MFRLSFWLLMAALSLPAAVFGFSYRLDSVFALLEDRPAEVVSQDAGRSRVMLSNTGIEPAHCAWGPVNWVVREIAAGRGNRVWAFDVAAGATLELDGNAGPTDHAVIQGNAILGGQPLVHSAQITCWSEDADLRVSVAR